MTLKVTQSTSKLSLKFISLPSTFLSKVYKPAFYLRTHQQHTALQQLSFRKGHQKSLIGVGGFHLAEVMPSANPPKSDRCWQKGEQRQGTGQPPLAAASLDTARSRTTGLWGQARAWVASLLFGRLPEEGRKRVRINIKPNSHHICH